MGHAGAEFWDQFFRQRRESGDDLDWEGAWTAPFLVPLREAGVRTILELGCGTGNDAAAALRGGARWGFAPNLLLWAALVAGSLWGAVAYHWINLAAIWFAAGSALALSAIVAVTIHL